VPGESLSRPPRDSARALWLGRRSVATDRGVVDPTNETRTNSRLPSARGSWRPTRPPGSPAYVLASLAGDEPAVLVIDQLDAVSQVLGSQRSDARLCRSSTSRRRQRFRMSECCSHRAASISRRTAPPPTSDSGRHSKSSRSVPSHDDQVDEVLREIGWTPSALTEKQRNLLRSPLHLRLLADAPRADPSFARRSISTRRSGTAKRDALRARVGDDSSWIGRDRRRLRLDERETVPECAGRRCRPLAAAGWRLAFRGRPDQTGSSDPLLSRRLLRFRVCEEVLGQRRIARRVPAFHGSGLFHRSQTRQILNYRRLADRDLFQRDLREVLSAPDIRFHLKTLVCAWLGTLDDPSQLSGMFCVIWLTPPMALALKSCHFSRRRRGG